MSVVSVPRWLGTILGSFAVASAMIRVILPSIARHLQEYRLLTGAMICAGLVFAAYPLFDSAMAMGSLFGVFGLWC